MTVTIAIANTKPGTSKTTSAVWLAAAFHERGGGVLLVDADPAGSAGQWDTLSGGFAWRTMDGSRESYLRQAPETAAARNCSTVLIDCPQIEDHPAITNLALRLADLLVIPVAPTPIEVERTTPMLTHIEAINSLRRVPLRTVVLLTRTVAQANSTADARAALAELGFDVLDTSVPRRETFAQSFGGPLPVLGADIWRAVAAELADLPDLAGVTR